MTGAPLQCERCGKPLTRKTVELWTTSDLLATVERLCRERIT